MGEIKETDDKCQYMSAPAALRCGCWEAESRMVTNGLTKFLTKLNIHLPYNPAIPLLDIYS